MLRAKQMGLSIAELDEMEEGLVMDMVIESGNDADRSIYRMINALKSFVIKIFDRKIRTANMQIEETELYHPMFDKLLKNPPMTI